MRMNCFHLVCLALGFSLTATAAFGQAAPRAAAGPAKPTTARINASKAPADRASAAKEKSTEPSKNSVQLGETVTTRWQLGMIVTAKSGPCRGLVGTAPMPVDWPEQQVKVVEEDFSPGVRVDYRMVTPSVKQLVIDVPFLPAGDVARALVTVEIKRSAQLVPADLTGFRMPQRLTPEMRTYLGASPGIEITNAKIREAAKELASTSEDPWKQVEAMYDWTREKVEYRNGSFKGAQAALKDGFGDCEELSSVFIALCRAQKIPARTVWVPDHCYPEFYLEDAEGNGHWIPCQAAGTHAFGSMPEMRPILQKGDNFRVGGKAQRYMAESLTGAGGKPSVKFVREIVGQQ